MEHWYVDIFFQLPTSLFITKLLIHRWKAIQPIIMDAKYRKFPNKKLVFMIKYNFTLKLFSIISRKKFLSMFVLSSKIIQFINLSSPLHFQKYLNNWLNNMYELGDQKTRIFKISIVTVKFPLLYFLQMNIFFGNVRWLS